MEKEYRGNTYCWMFVLFLNTLLIVDLLRMLTNGNSTIVSVAQYGLYGISGAYAYYQVILKQAGKLKKSVFFIIALILVSLGISYIVCPSSAQAYSYFIPLLLIRIIPALYYVTYLTISDLEQIFYRMVKCVIFWIVYALVGIVYISAHTVSWGQYASNFGFNLLLPACFSLYRFIKEKKPIWIILTILFALAIALRGSRTALLCFIIFAVMFYFISFSKQMTGNKIVLFLLVAIVAVLLALNYSTLFSWSSSIFPSSRTLRLLVSGFSFDSGRSDIHELFINEIENRPFAFRGIFSDRVFYASATGSVFDITGYPHSFLIELIYQFGIIFGAVLLIPLIIYSFKALVAIYCSENIELKCIVLLLFTAGIVKLFFSGSYLTTIEFYLYLGLVVTIAGKVKERIE